MTFSTLREACDIVGASNVTTPFGWNSKMPVPCYGLPAADCHRGSELAKRKDSPCHPDHCYAKRNRYKWPNMVTAREKHLASLTNPRWAEAFAWILERVYPTAIHFRLHDSGDLQGVWHLDMLVDVARRRPQVKFWLPTHEPWYVASWLMDHGSFPENFVVRLSADAINARLAWSGLDHVLRGKVATSTIHPENSPPVQVSDRRRDSVECRAHDRGNQCGPCRACWTLDVRNVSYPLTHGTRRGRRSDQLRIFQ